MPTPPVPRPRGLAELKANILRPATTSNFQCYFQPPPSVLNWMEDRQSAGLGKAYVGQEDFLGLNCAEASLPGSTFATHEITNDFAGVTERHAYRRQYDDRAQFTFYVDHDYQIINFFENWMAFIANEQRTRDARTDSISEDTRSYSYRMNFPEQYQSTIYINKFEKDIAAADGSGEKYLTYCIHKAFPISINSMPISYEASQILKCTVSFTYSRYLISPPEESIIQRNIRFQNRIDPGVAKGPAAGERILGQTGAGTVDELRRINTSTSNFSVFNPPIA